MPVTTLMASSLLGGGNSPGQGIANIAGGLISGITGLSQKRKARKLLREAGDQPLMQMPEEITRNQKMAEITAEQGLPSQQYNNAMKNIQRTQASLLSGASDRRSALMALPKLQQQSNDATSNLDAQDAMMKLNNQKTLYSVGNTTAAYKDKLYQNNQLQPWLRKYNYANQLLGAGNQNFTSGLDKLIGGIGQFTYGNNFSSNKRMTTSTNTNDPSYYGGYNANSNYSNFENGY
jgi:hypothetical protein